MTLRHRLHVTLAAPLLALAMHTAQAQPPVPPKIKIVAQLYYDFAGENVLDEPLLPERDLLVQPRAVLARYFTPELTDLLITDRECARRNREICHLDFNPIWHAQDLTGDIVRVEDNGPDGRVKVSMTPMNGPTRSTLFYTLQHTQQGWRVADIDYGEGHSLLKILRSKL